MARYDWIHWLSIAALGFTAAVLAVVAFTV
jgi:hypothetical protein